MKNALFQNKRHLAPVSFVTGLFLLLTVLVNPIFVSASGLSSNLPYIPKNTSYYLSESDYNLINSCLHEYDSNLDMDNSNVIIFKGLEGGWFTWSEYTDLPSYYVYFVGGISCTSSFPTGKDFSNYIIGTDDPLSIGLPDTAGYVIRRTDLGGYGNNQYYVGTTLSNSIVPIQFFGSYNPQHNSRFNFDYVDHYPVYCNQNFETTDSNLVVDVFCGIGYPSSVVGSAVAPSFGAGAGVGGSDFLGTGADFGASISQATMPSQPTINNYTWNTYNPPSVDTSTLESLVESLIDIVKYNSSYITEGIKGTLETIIANIQAYGSYIGSLIAYVGRSIITNIQNGIQNLYENIVSLFEPVLKAFQEIINLGLDSDGNFSLTTLFVNLAIPSESDFQQAVSDSDTFGLISVAGSVNSKILSEVNTLKGLSSSKIIHVPSCYYHGMQIGDYDIDFSWYDNYKSLGDGIISAFLIWNYIWFLFFRLPSFIRGQGGAFVSDVNSSVDYSHQFKNS